MIFTPIARILVLESMINMIIVLVISTSYNLQIFFFFFASITTDGDCSHEIKRCILLGRKVMTNLDSILKSRNTNLPTKVYLVKATVFPVVMQGCESWTIQKAEH